MQIKIAAGLIVLVVATYIATDPNMYPGRRTIYQGYCTDLKHSVLDCPTGIKTSIKHYHVLPTAQMVVEKTDKSVVKFTNCTVFDKDNWECPFMTSAGNAAISIHNGKFSRTDSTKVTEGKYAPDDPNLAPFYPLYDEIPRLMWNLRDLFAK